MLVSIIICTRDRADALAETLASLARLEIPAALSCELVVVDNASKNSMAAVVQSAPLQNMAVRFVREDTPGKSFAYNAGLAAARGDLLLFTDDDVRPPVHWIAGMCAPLLAGEADAVGGGVRLSANTCKPWMQATHRIMLASTEDLAPGTLLPSLLGANMAFARHVLAHVPRFDPELGPGASGFCEDSLFCLQLREAGYRIATKLDVIVEHHPDLSRITPRSFVARVVKEGQSQAYISYHWEHDLCLHDEGTFPPEGFAHIRLTLLRRILALAGLRLTRRRERKLSSIIPDWELRKIRQIAFYHQYLIERRRPRNYDRRGLIKKLPAALASSSSLTKSVLKG